MGVVYQDDVQKTNRTKTHYDIIGWSFVRKTLLDDWPETDVYLVVNFTRNRRILKSVFRFQNLNL